MWFEGGGRRRCIVDYVKWPAFMCSYLALHNTKIHTPITLGIGRDAKPLVFKLQEQRPCGFDSHRPLHSQAWLGHAGICHQSTILISPCVPTWTATARAKHG